MCVCVCVCVCVGVSVCVCMCVVHVCVYTCFVTGTKKVCLGEMALGSTHYYYGNYNQFARCPKQRRELTPAFLDSLASVDQEERQSVRHSIAKELGFKGTTIFHQFYHLYGFKLTTDFVIDAQHGLPLGVVKHDFQRMFDDSSELDGEEGTSQSHKFKLLSERLAKFPWTAGSCSNYAVYVTV